jgi:putative transposase
MKMAVLALDHRRTAHHVAHRGELRNGEIFATLLEAKILIERWRREYNTIRPHSALGYRPPGPEAVQPWFPAFATLQRETKAEILETLT